MSVLQSVEFWISFFSVLSGGVLVKIIQIIADRRKNALNLTTGEKEDLRGDIQYLRGEIELLRSDVKDLREELEQTQAELSTWQRRYWSKKVELDKVLIQVRHLADENLKRRVFDVVVEEEESLNRGEGV